MVLEFIFIAFIVAFILQFLDASAGMGYGTLTAILIILGFAPLESVSAVIFTSAVLSLFAGVLHHNFKNVNFSQKKNKNILLVLIGFGIIAIFLGVFLATNVSSLFLKIYVGGLVILVGVFILIQKKKKSKFSWKRLMAFGFLASFNKGLAGNGYGPVLAGGQILSGVNPKKAVGITALSEGIVSLIGFILFIFINGFSDVNWSLVTSLTAGGLISTPLATYFVKKVKSNILKYLIAIISIGSGVFIIFKIF